VVCQFAVPGAEVVTMEASTADKIPGVVDKIPRARPMREPTSEVEWRDSRPNTHGVAFEVSESGNGQTIGSSNRVRREPCAGPTRPLAIRRSPTPLA